MLFAHLIIGLWSKKVIKAILILSFQLKDTYYDIVDALESQGLEDAMKQMIRLGQKDLIDQCKLYEKVLKQEDEADSNDESNIVKMR